MERLKVLAASVALKEFTIPQLVAYSGANERTVRSVLLRDSELFERLSETGEMADADQAPGSGMADGAASRDPGRPAMKWRVVDPQQIRRLVTGVQKELEEARKETIEVPEQPAEVGVQRLRFAAVKVAEDAVVRAWEENDSELRCVLAETALNNLAHAAPPLADDEAESPGSEWWSIAPSTLPGGAYSEQDETLRLRAEGTAVLARLVDAEARGRAVSVEQLAEAAVAVSRLGPVLPAARVREFFERLVKATFANRLSANPGKVLGELITAKSSVSMGDVAQRTGLPQGEVELALKPLMLRKYVVADLRGLSRERVWPTTPLRVNEANHRAIGVSVLPDKVIGVLTNLRALGTTVKYREFGISSRGPVDVDVVISAIASLVEEFRTIRSDVLGLGVELPGHATRQGEVVFSPILKQTNIPLKEKLEAVTGLATVVENDANALAVHAQWFGDGTDSQNFAVILLPERGGVGSGLVSNGQVVYGSEGSAGELGHIEFKPGGERCDCGKRGCLETVAGVSGILREVTRLGHSPDTLAAAAALADRDKGVRDIFEHAGQALGWGISVTLNLLDPERVIVFAPTQLIEDKRYSSAKLFLTAVQEASRKRAFSRAEQTRQLFRRIPGVPVLPYEWRTVPQQATSPAVAASAVLGHVIRGPLEWAKSEEELALSR